LALIDFASAFLKVAVVIASAYGKRFPLLLLIFTFVFPASFTRAEG
jgi:hypothetical protein